MKWIGRADEAGLDPEGPRNRIIDLPGTWSVTSDEPIMAGHLKLDETGNGSRGKRVENAAAAQ